MFIERYPNQEVALADRMTAANAQAGPPQGLGPPGASAPPPASCADRASAAAVVSRSGTGRPFAADV